MKIYSIIPAGGSGTRLWPVSSEESPKFLFDLLGRNKSLLQETYERISEFSKDVFVVCGQIHKKQIQKQLPMLKNIIIEPSPKNSMGAIGIATYIIAKKYGHESIVGSFAADQVIEGKFKKTVKNALKAVNEGYIATIGIVATENSTAYGYIKALNKKIHETLIIDEFIEKPDQQTADHYIKVGNYFWNAGMFIFKASTLIDALKELNPKMHKLFDKISNLIIEKKDFSFEWEKLESIAIDYQIAEPYSKMNKVVVAPAEFQWSDIGDWKSVSDYLKGNVKGDTENLTEQSSSNVFVYNKSNQKKITIIGMHDVSIINTDSDLLILKNISAQSVKNIAKINMQNKQNIIKSKKK